MIRRVPLAVVVVLALALGSAAAPATAQSVAGIWALDVTLDAGNGRATFNLQVVGTTITGSYGGVLGEQAVTGTVEGNVAKFGFESPDAGSVRFEGIVDGNKMEGTCEYGALGAGSFAGTRAP